MFDWRDYGNGIVAFDSGYVRPVLAAIHLIVENSRVAFIDTGSNDALPNALAALQKLGLDVTAVYGAEYVTRVYGDIIPVPAARIIEATDGLVLSLAGRQLRCLDTPGHARHHICIVDEKTSAIFTGDMFGLSCRELDVQGRQFIFPTTTPSGSH